MKKLYIIAGPNGAGKTTASLEYLDKDLECFEFVNADMIAYGLSPFKPEEVAVSAGKLMLKRVNELIDAGVDFAIETTLSSLTLLNHIKRAQENGFQVSLLYYWLDSYDLALMRVKSRVESGGHNIPAEVVVRRYHRGLANFFEIYRRNVDYWLMLNNSDLNPAIIADGTKESINIVDPIIWERIEVNYDKGK